jgi:hypothetical protein
VKPRKLQRSRRGGRGRTRREREDQEGEAQIEVAFMSGTPLETFNRDIVIEGACFNTVELLHSAW